MLFFIVNPTAGSGRALSAMKRIASLLDERGIEYTISESEFRGHATQLARQAIGRGYDAIVAVGGDGTVAEVAEGLIGSHETMGVVPGGTGNDYRRSIGVPDTPEGALEVILAGKCRKMDGIWLDDRFFLNVAHGGFDVQVIRNTEKFKRLGGAAYYVSAFYTALKGFSVQAKLTFDDGFTHEGRILLVSVGCGKYYGGGMKVLPLAIGDDGLLDVLYVEAVSSFKIIRLLPAFIKGAHMKFPFTHHRLCRSMKLEVAGGDFYAAGDGEVLGKRNAITFTVEPGAIDVICG